MGGELQDKTILVTGATDGIGRQTALVLAQRGGRVLLHGRSEERCRRTRREIKERTGNQALQTYIADFADLAQVRALADEVRRDHGRLDVLLNNAGVWETSRRTSRDGFEMTLAVNHLAPFLLTNRLLDPLRAVAPSRIVNVSSMIHAGHIDFDDLQSEKGYSAQAAYGLSKLCNVLFTYELAERLAGTGVTANCLHPGVIDTKLFRAGWSAGGSPIEAGSRNTVYVATAPELEGVTGKYFVNQRPAESQPISHDPEARRRLWRLSAALVGLNDG